MVALGQWIGKVLDFHEPCVLCANPDAQDGWCKDCLAHLPMQPVACCTQCARALPTHALLCGACLKKPFYFDRLYATLRFDYPLIALIHAWKYQKRYELSHAIASLGQRFAPTLTPDIIIPVPLSKKRLAQRGFNQSNILAQALAENLHCPLSLTMAWRQRDTPSQTQFNAAKRQQNMRHAFAVSQAVKGQSVLLVDDVATSGATLSSLAKTLKKQGAKAVDAWVLARTQTQRFPAPGVALHQSSMGEFVLKKIRGNNIQHLTEIRIAMRSPPNSEYRAYRVRADMGLIALKGKHGVWLVSCTNADYPHKICLERKK